MGKKRQDIKTLLPEGPIGYWPANRGEDPVNGDWVVGVAVDRVGAPMEWRNRKRPCDHYDMIAAVCGRDFARSLVAHFTAVRDAK